MENIAGSYNGSTTDSESVYLGPNPSPAAEYSYVNIDRSASKNRV